MIERGALERASGRRGARFDRRGGGSVPRWSPAALGSKLKLWLDERGQSGSPIDSWANQTVGVNSFTAATTARPTVGSIGGLAAPDFEPTDDIMTSTSALSALISASSYYYAAVFSLDGVTGVSANAYQNNTIIADSGGFWGLHLKDAGSGNVTVQAFHWDGAQQVAEVTVAVATSPLTAQVWYDGTTIRLTVNGSAEGTDTAGSVSTLTGTLRLGTGQILRLNGRIGMIAVCNAVSTAAERTSMASYVSRWGTPLYGLAPSLAQMWGNGWDSVTGENRFYSALSMMVFDTDSPTVDVEYYTNSAAVDPRYSALAVGTSLTSQTKPTAIVGTVLADTAVGRHRSGPISTGATLGGASKRVYVINGGLSGFVGAQAQRVWIAQGASLSIVSEPVAPTVSVEGWGSVKLGGASSASGATLGWASSGGVLQGGAFATRRTETLTRAAAYKAPAAIIVETIHTNDATSGLGGTDAGVQAGALLDDLQTTFPGVPILWITMIRRWTENATTAAIRSAEEAACAARSVDVVDGLTLGSENFTTADLSTSPDVHPNDSGHRKLANVKLAWLTAHTITGPVLTITNSIGNDSGTEVASGLQMLAAQDGSSAWLREERT